MLTKVKGVSTNISDILLRINQKTKVFSFNPIMVFLRVLINFYHMKIHVFLVQN